VRELPIKRIMPSAQKGFRDDVLALFGSASIQVRGILSRFPVGASAGAQRSVRREVRQYITSLFVNSQDEAFGWDGVTAQAEFPRILNKAYAKVVSDTVYAHQKWMRRNIPSDIYAWLRRRGRRLATVSEQFDYEGLNPDTLAALRIFSPNPLLELDPERRWVPMHRWNTPNGYSLSDNIWRAGQQTRDRIDALLVKGFQQGQSALSIAAAVEAYLLPNEVGRRTLKPYGRVFMPPGGAAYSAMRLARTEIARAANQASFVSGYLNPYTTTLDVARSRNGDPTCKVCPIHATIGIYGERIREPYLYENAPIPPEVTHPYCMCNVRPGVTSSPETVSQQLRVMMDEARTEYLEPVITPVQADVLLEQLIGQALMNLLIQIPQLSF
jgi:hypothetical protein